MALALEHVEDLARPDQMELLAGDPLELVVVLAKGVEAASRFVALLNQIEALALDLAELAPQLDDAGDPAIAPQSRGEEPEACPREEDCHPVAACELEPVGHSPGSIAPPSALQDVPSTQNEVLRDGRPSPSSWWIREDVRLHGSEIIECHSSELTFPVEG